MKKLLWLTFFSFMAGTLISTGISTRLYGYHGGRGFHGFATRPNSIAPQWATNFVAQFEARHGRIPTQIEMEHQASAKFTRDLRRMKLTWNGVVERAADESSSAGSNNSSPP